MTRSPELGIGAIVVRDGSILLVKRGNEPYQGEWSVPGGRVERGESLKSAVKREVLEETGISIAVGDLCYHFEYIAEDDSYHYIVLDYFGFYLEGEVSAGDDADDAQWISLDDLNQLQLNKKTDSALKSLGIIPDIKDR